MKAQTLDPADAQFCRELEDLLMFIIKEMDFWENIPSKKEQEAILKRTRRAVSPKPELEDALPEWAVELLSPTVFWPESYCLCHRTFVTGLSLHAPTLSLCLRFPALSLCPRFPALSLCPRFPATSLCPRPPATSLCPRSLATSLCPRPPAASLCPRSLATSLCPRPPASNPHIVIKVKLHCSADCFSDI
ncbi:unnamed protein product [Gadus morhua 'NCC']